VGLRAARPDEAEALTELCWRAKAVWGYGEDLLAESRGLLRLDRDDVVERRAVVAERDGSVVGVATLEGEPPRARLGLLFVEPAAIGGGVGRRLYRHVLEEADRLGFDRVTIDADPHAAGFYAAMGAERQDGAGPRRDDDLVGFVAWPIRPEPAWSTAWSGGGPTVQVGNVAEFNGQFGGRVEGPDHYSCLVALCGPRPAAIVVPQPVDDWWVRHLSTALGWRDVEVEVEVHHGIGPDGRVSAAIGARADLLAGLRAPGRTVLPWGRTAAFEAVAPSPPGVLAAVRRYESKRGAHELFRALAADHPGIGVPEQRPASRWALARALADRAPVVLKREYGVGGSGTVVVTPGRGHRRALALALARRCRALGATLLVTIPTAAFDPVPYLGVALAARTRRSLDEAEAAARAPARRSGRCSVTWRSVGPVLVDHEADDHRGGDHEGDVEPVHQGGLHRPVVLRREPVEVVLGPPGDQQPRDRQVGEPGEPPRTAEARQPFVTEEEEADAQPEGQALGHVEPGEQPPVVRSGNDRQVGGPLPEHVGEHVRRQRHHHRHTHHDHRVRQLLGAGTEHLAAGRRPRLRWQRQAVTVDLAGARTGQGVDGEHGARHPVGRQAQARQERP
jgi:GNAT superfamily N-acetyltransferase